MTGTQVFDAFGNQVAATGSTASALQWQGANLYRSYAPDAGLLQAGARYYDPQVGRFITRDTHLNQRPYIYCNGDPVNRSDPNGHATLARAWFAIPADHEPPRFTFGPMPSQPPVFPVPGWGAPWTPGLPTPPDDGGPIDTGPTSPLNPDEQFHCIPDLPCH